MKKAIMATKIGMTQIFREDGTLVPVTEAKERITTVDKNGKKEVAHRHGVGKAMKGHFDKAGVAVKKHVQEFKFENAAEYKLGDEIKADIFAEGDKIDATAVTKGKGFQGAIKRLGQHRGPMGHGSKFHRHQGSNGSSSDPSRVFRSQQSLQGQRNARTHGQRPGYDPEPGSSESGCGQESDSGQRRYSGT